MVQSSSSPSVSVVVAAYNVEDYVEECVLSLEAQTYKNLEIVVVDDGSTDRTPEILAELASRPGSRVKVLTQVNMGLSDARNQGLDFSTGELVCFVDGDDQVAPTMVAALISGMELSGADLVACKHLTYVPGANIYWPATPYRVRVYRQPAALEETLSFRGAGTNPWAKLAGRDLWLRHRFPSRLIYEDLATIPAVIADCKIIAVVEAGLYGFAVRPGSITREETVVPQRILDMREAISLALAGVHAYARYPVSPSSIAAREAVELGRLIQLVDRTSNREAVSEIKTDALRRLRVIAPPVVVDRRMPREVRLRVALGAVSPWIYSAVWRVSKLREGWL